MALSPEERFKLEYDTVNSYILHYSNVRSALSSFLITVALASFAGYYSTSTEPTVAPGGLATEGATHPLLWFAGYVFLVAAVLASLRFSYLTERAAEYSVQLWRWGIEGKRDYPGGFRSSSWVRGDEIWRRVRKDPMNWLLIVGATVLAVVFPLFEIVS